MKATKDYTSLETAKLLSYSKLSWQEILWEHSEQFFGKELFCYDCGEKVGKPLESQLIQIGNGTCSCSRQFENNEYAYEFHSKELLYLLQHKKYEDADKYFREHCMLIKQY